MVESLVPVVMSGIAIVYFGLILKSWDDTRGSVGMVESQTITDQICSNWELMQYAWREGWTRKDAFKRYNSVVHREYQDRLNNSKK